MPSKKELCPVCQLKLTLGSWPVYRPGEETKGYRASAECQEKQGCGWWRDVYASTRIRAKQGIQAILAVERRDRVL